MLKKEETKKALEKIVKEDLTGEYAEQLFTIYARNNYGLYMRIHTNTTTAQCIAWDIVLTTINNEMDYPGKYAATAQQVREIMKSWGLNYNGLLEIARKVYKREMLEE